MKKRLLRLLFLITLFLHAFILVQGSLPAKESAAESYAVLVLLGVVFPFLTHTLLRKKSSTTSSLVAPKIICS